MEGIVLNNSRVNEIIGKLMLNKQEPKISNIIYKSLASSGGTITETEGLKQYLKENVFYFNEGVIFTDVENSLVYLNGKKMKVVVCPDFVYSILKTRIKAVNGIKGFKNHISENRVFGDTFYFTINSILKKLKDEN